MGGWPDHESQREGSYEKIHTYIDLEDPKTEKNEQWEKVHASGTAFLSDPSPIIVYPTSGRSMDWEKKNVSRWIFFEIGRW